MRTKQEWYDSQNQFSFENMVSWLREQDGFAVRRTTFNVETGLRNIDCRGIEFDESGQVWCVKGGNLSSAVGFTMAESEDLRYMTLRDPESGETISGEALSLDWMAYRFRDFLIHDGKLWHCNHNTKFNFNVEPGAEAIQILEPVNDRFEWRYLNAEDRRMWGKFHFRLHKVKRTLKAINFHMTHVYDLETVAEAFNRKRPSEVLNMEQDEIITALMTPSPLSKQLQQMMAIRKSNPTHNMCLNTFRTPYLEIVNDE